MILNPKNIEIETHQLKPGPHYRYEFQATGLVMQMYIAKKKFIYKMSVYTDSLLANYLYKTNKIHLLLGKLFFP